MNEAVFERLLGMLDLPALVLVVLLAASAWILWRAQRNKKFDLSNMLRDAEGKESGLRFAVLGAFAVSSWFLMRMALRDGAVEPEMYWAYLITWSGAQVLAKAAEKWDGRLPWAPRP